MHKNNETTACENGDFNLLFNTSAKQHSNFFFYRGHHVVFNELQNKQVVYRCCQTQQ